MELGSRRLSAHWTPQTPRDVESRYLLTGFARCAVCGGNLGVSGGSHRSGKGHVYGCLAYHKRGTSVCGNGLKIPMGRIDAAVLKAIAGDVLRPAVVNAVLAGVLAAMSPRSIARDVRELRTEVVAVERELERLTEAIAAGGPLASLLEALTARQRRRDELAAELIARDVADVGHVNLKRIEAQARDHMKTWRALLTTHVSDGRQLLREVLVRPLRFTPEGRTYRFEGEAAVGRLLAGSVGLTTTGVAVRGIEPRFDG